MGDWAGAFKVMFVMAAVIGWALIELLLWLFSHITIGWA